MNSHPFQGTHWVAYNNQFYMNYFAFSIPQNFSTFLTKRNGNCLSSGYKIQGLTIEKRFLLCSLLFFYNLLDQSLGNRFQISCVKFILSKIFFTEMTVRKITSDNKVRYVNKDIHSHSEQLLPVSKEGDDKPPNTRKGNANNNKLPQKDKKLNKYITSFLSD